MVGPSRPYPLRPFDMLLFAPDFDTGPGNRGGMKHIDRVSMLVP